MGDVLCQIFKIILNIYEESMGKRRLIFQWKYINKIENRITYKIKTGYYLELLTPEKMKLLGSIKCKITKERIGEIVPDFEMAEKY